MMSALQLRKLSNGERTLCDQVFRGAVDLDRLRLFAIPGPRSLMRPFVPGEVLWTGRYWAVFPTFEAYEDFADAPVGNQARFVHEVVHVWQSQNGRDMLQSKISAGERYAYTLARDSRWEGFNIEQQAMIVEDDFRLRRGLPARFPQAVPLEEYARVQPFGRPASPA